MKWSAIYYINKKSLFYIFKLFFHKEFNRFIPICTIVEYKIYLFIVILLNKYFIDIKNCHYFAFDKIMSSPNSITFIFYPICIEFTPWCRIFTYILNVIIPNEIKNETVFFFLLSSSI